MLHISCMYAVAHRMAADAHSHCCSDTAIESFTSWSEFDSQSSTVYELMYGWAWWKYIQLRLEQICSVISAWVVAKLLIDFESQFIWFFGIIFDEWNTTHMRERFNGPIIVYFHFAESASIFRTKIFHSRSNHSHKIRQIIVQLRTSPAALNANNYSPFALANYIFLEWAQKCDILKLILSRGPLIRRMLQFRHEK